MQEQTQKSIFVAVIAKISEVTGTFDIYGKQIDKGLELLMKIDMLTFQQTKADNVSDEMISDPKTQRCIKNLMDSLTSTNNFAWKEKINSLIKNKNLSEIKAYKKNPVANMPYVISRSWYLDYEDIDGLQTFFVDSNNPSTPGLWQQAADNVNYDKVTDLISDDFLKWGECAPVTIMFF